MSAETLGFSGVCSEDIKAEDFLKIAIVGEPKVGKSWLAATAPAPVRIFDFDDRAESLEGKPGCIILSKPSMTNVETDLSIAKANKIQGKPIPKTWVFDSVTYMQRAMEEEIFRQDKTLARAIKVGPGKEMLLRKNWDAINGIQRYMEYLIAEFSPLGNIIFVFHERIEKDYAKSTPEKSAYTGDITVDPQYLANSLSLFNEVYRISLTWDNKFQVQCRQTSNFKACTTMLLGENEPPSIMEMISKHQKARAAQKATAKP